MRARPTADTWVLVGVLAVVTGMLLLATLVSVTFTSVRVSPKASMAGEFESQVRLTLALTPLRLSIAGGVLAAWLGTATRILRRGAKP